MALRPGFDPEQSQRPAPNKKATRQRNVDLQHFLQLGGERQSLIETPPSTPSLLSGDNLLTSGAPGPTYTFDPQSTSNSGFFGGSDVAQDLLTAAGKQKTAYDPSAVTSARQKLIEALSSPGPAKPTGLTGSRAGGEGIAYNNSLLHDREAVDSAQTMLDTALRAQRERAIGNTVADQGAGNIKKRTDELTESEYNAMSPLQKAAIDFNTLLADAVRKDRNNADVYDPAPKQRDVYDSSVESMFGEDRGADGVYAPETVALLKKLHITDKSGDLNDYLSLNASIKARDLEDLKPEELAPGTNATSAENQALNPAHPLAEDRLSLERDLAHSTKQMETALAQGVQLLSSINTTFKVEQGNLLDELGGIRNTPKTGLGWDELTTYNPQATPENDNQYFITAFDTLAQKGNGPRRDEILQAVQSNLSDSQYDAFLNYVSERSSNAERFGQPLGTVKGVDYLKPSAFREMLGLDSGGPGAVGSPPAAAPREGGGY